MSINYETTLFGDPTTLYEYHRYRETSTIQWFPKIQVYRQSETCPSNDAHDSYNTAILHAGNWHTSRNAGNWHTSRNIHFHCAAVGRNFRSRPHAMPTDGSADYCLAPCLHRTAG
jgi:hypothetical protein